MIIVVKGADFSQNNLGQIPINLPLDAFVIKTMQNLTKYPSLVSNGYAQALNMLYTSMVAKGLWDKIKVLGIPCMAASVEECAFNVKDSSTQPNALTSVNLYYALDSKGWMRRNTEDLVGINRGWDIDLTTDNMCMFGILRQNVADQAIITAGYDTNYYRVTNYVANPNDDLMQVFENGVGTAVDDRLVANGGFVLNFHGGFTTMQDSISTVTTAAASTTRNLTRFVPLGGFGSPESSDKSLALFGCGEGLTVSEASALQIILTDFYNAL